MRSAAVIGTGFLGRALVLALRASGVSVTGFGRGKPLREGADPHPALRVAGSVFFTVGTCTPAGMQADPRRANEELVALRRLLAVLSLLDEPPVLVLAGSGGVIYDPGGRPPYGERAPISPTTEYGRLKVAEESLVDEWSAGSAPVMRPVTLRFSNVYGPGQRPGTGQGVIAHWLDAAARGAPLELFGDPDSSRDYLYLDDAIAALVAVHHAAGRALPRELNIGSGAPTSLRELADLVLRTTADPGSELVVGPARSVDRKECWLDVSLAAATLGWRPRVSLVDGLAETWSAMRPAAVVGAVKEPAID